MWAAAEVPKMSTTFKTFCQGSAWYLAVVVAANFLCFVDFNEIQRRQLHTGHDFQDSSTVCAHYQPDLRRGPTRPLRFLTPSLNNELTFYVFQLGLPTLRKRKNQNLLKMGSERLTDAL